MAMELESGLPQLIPSTAQVLPALIETPAETQQLRSRV
jgi:hypothetical protein